MVWVEVGIWSVASLMLIAGTYGLYKHYQSNRRIVGGAIGVLIIAEMLIFSGLTLLSLIGAGLRVIAITAVVLSLSAKTQDAIKESRTSKLMANTASVGLMLLAGVMLVLLVFDITLTGLQIAFALGAIAFSVSFEGLIVSLMRSDRNAEAIIAASLLAAVLLTIGILLGLGIISWDLVYLSVTGLGALAAVLAVLLAPGRDAARDEG